MKFICLLVFFYSGLLNAQNQDFNVFNTHYSYAFFGRGDLNGSSIGMHIKHFFKNRIGISAGLIHYRALGGELPRASNAVVINARVFGSDPNRIKKGISIYTVLSSGINYLIRNREKEILYIGASINYKYGDYNQIGAVSYSGVDQLRVEILDYQFERIEELTLGISLDYSYMVYKNTSIGIRGATDISGNKLSSFGLSIGFVF